MNNSKTPKIVVGVGLAAVYATIAVFLIPRGAHDNVVAQDVPAAPAQIASEPALPPAIAPAPAEVSTSVAEQPAAATVAAAPVATTAAKPVATPAPRKVETKPQANAQSIANEEPIAREQPIARVATAAPAAESEVEEPSLAGEGNDAVNEGEGTEEVPAQVAALASDGSTDPNQDGAVLSN